MKTAYVDCIAGASGDMLLGALVDAGLGEAGLRDELAKLRLEGFDLRVRRVSKNGFGAIKVDVDCQDDAPERYLAQIRAVVEGGDLTPAVRDRALRVFTRLCQVEADTHGKTIDSVHLHEVGAVDAIVDVVGVVAGFRRLGVDRVVVSPLPMGRGFIDGAHGKIPLPAPATVGLLKGVPVRPADVEAELVTPTGAALLVELADAFGPMPEMTVESVGYGAGTRDLGIPNVLRLFIGRGGAGGEWTRENLVMLETNLDDETGEAIGRVVPMLMAAGALDVFVVPGLMKKGRPACRLEVLARPATADALRHILFRETSTLGIRCCEVARDALPRETTIVATPVGDIPVKIARLPGGGYKVIPEFEDCRRLAEVAGLPFRDVFHQAIAAARTKEG